MAIEFENLDELGELFMEYIYSDEWLEELDIIAKFKATLEAMNKQFQELRNDRREKEHLESELRVLRNLMALRDEQNK